MTADSADYETGAMDSKRKEMKELVKSLKKINPNVDQNIFMAHHNVNLNTCCAFTFGDKKYSFLDYYDQEEEDGTTFDSVIRGKNN